MGGDSSNQNENTSSPVKSSMLTWLLAGGCGCFALLSCIACGGVGAWIYLQKNAKPMEGAWEYARGPIAPNLRGVKVVVGNQLIATIYDRNTKKAVILNGATFTLDGSSYKENIEFCTPGIQQILLGKEQAFTARFSGDNVDVIGTLSNGNPIDESWKRIASPKGDPNEGAWELVKSTLNPAWRAVKLVSGGQFVFVVYDRKLKFTHAIRGGSYSVKDKTLVESPDYFEHGPAEVLLKQDTAEIRFDDDEMTATRVVMPDRNINTEIWKRIK